AGPEPGESGKGRGTQQLKKYAQNACCRAKAKGAEGGCGGCAACRPRRSARRSWSTPRPSTDGCIGVAAGSGQRLFQDVDTSGLDLRLTDERRLENGSVILTYAPG